MITLLGATGYTGRLVARALDRSGLPYRLAGRSAEKLTRLAAELPARPDWLLADVTHPDTLPPLMEGPRERPGTSSRVVVNCAGPFTDLGEAVVAQAALHGVHYLDTTNELGYVYRLRSYDSLARHTGAAIVPACGFEVVLADCAAAVLAAGLPTPLDEVRVVYDVRGSGSSLGTRRSAIRSLATSWLAYRGGRWVRALPGRQARRQRLGGECVPALSFPSSETVTVPGHLEVNAVTTWLAASRHALWWAPLLVPAFAWLARGPLGRVAAALSSRIAPPPAGGLRSEARFAIQVTERGGGEESCLLLAGRGVYELTAEIAAYAAARLAGPGMERAGVLPPAVALEPQTFFDHATANWGLTVERDAG